MNYIEILGYLASGAVFMTFWMKTMVPLRTLAIASNVLFFCYGLYDGLTPILVLHGCLLPLNSVRLYQAISLSRKIRRLAHAAFDPKALLPFMEQRRFARGSVLFQRGDAAHEIYYLAEGRAHVVELGIDIEPGNIVGEIAIFSPEQIRTQTITCQEDCLFFCISEERALHLYCDKPEFGVYLIQMIVARLLANAKTAGGRVAV